MPEAEEAPSGQRVRLAVVIAFEYEPVPENYPEGLTVKEMGQVDAANILEAQDDTLVEMMAGGDWEAEATIVEVVG